MLNSQLPYSWHTLSVDDEDNNWDAILDSELNPECRDRTLVTQPRLIHELLLALVIAIVVVEYILWQRAEVRLLSLQRELQEVSKTLLTIHEQMNSISPIIDSTGAARTAIETSYFRFEFAAKDTQVVAAVADIIDAEYVQLRQDFALELPDASKKLLVAVIADENDRAALLSPEALESTLKVSSPVLLAAGGHGNPEQVLRQQLLIQIARRCLAEALQSKEIQAPWQTMVRSIELYLWREQVTLGKWRQNPEYLPNRYDAQDLSVDLALQTGYLSAEEYERRSSVSDIANWVTDLLTEFIMFTYGYPIVPNLLDGFSQHDNWDTLTPQVFSMSVIEFENQWHEYLQAQASIN